MHTGSSTKRTSEAVSGTLRLLVEPRKSGVSCATGSKEGAAGKATRADITIRRIGVEAKTIESLELLGDSLAFGKTIGSSL